MTREEAIKILTEYFDGGCTDFVWDAYQLAITALEAQDVDAVSRQAVMWMLTNLLYTQCKTQGEADVIEIAKTMVITMPSAQASYRQVTGKLDVTDCISRQDAIDATWKDPSYTDPLNVLTEVRDRIKALPSAQPEPYRGEGEE